MIGIKNFIGRIGKKLSGMKTKIFGAVPLAFFHSVALSTASIGTTIFNGIWKLLLSFLAGIVSGMTTMFNSIFQGFAQSIVIMFQGFGFALSGYGVFGPTMFAVGIGMAVMVAYLFFMFIDSEKDVTEVEDDI